MTEPELDYDVSDIKVIDNVLQMMKLANGDDQCFQRLICDIGASGGDGYDSASIANVIALTFPIRDKLSKEGRTMWNKLDAALNLGATEGQVEVCEKTYNCPHSGKQLDKLIQDAKMASDIKENENGVNLS